MHESISKVLVTNQFRVFNYAEFKIKSTCRRHGLDGIYSFIRWEKIFCSLALTKNARV